MNFILARSYGKVGQCFAVCDSKIDSVILIARRLVRSLWEDWWTKHLSVSNEIDKIILMSGWDFAHQTKYRGPPTRELKEE